MSWILSTKFGRALAALGGLLVAIAAAFLAGKREGRRDAAANELRDYRETRKRSTMRTFPAVSRRVAACSWLVR